MPVLLTTGVENRKPDYVSALVLEPSIENKSLRGHSDLSFLKFDVFCIQNSYPLVRKPIQFLWKKKSFLQMSQISPLFSVFISLLFVLII